MRHHMLFASVVRHQEAITKTIASLFFIILFYPITAFYLGNAFFGGIKPLYNLTFAKFFYTIATHPVHSSLTPWSAHYQLARVYFVRGDLFTSLDEANKELAINPTNYISYYIIGLDYGYLGMPYDGIKAFDRYIDQNPGTWAGRNDKAWLQFRIGDISGALATVEPVINFYPLTPWIQNTYCSLLLNTDQKEKAKEVCEHAKTLISKMSPNDWGHAYPGNDPSIYSYGVDAMKKSSEQNAVISNETQNQ